MDRDERIALAQRLASELKGVDRNEWLKFVLYLREKESLHQALTLAAYLTRIPLLRREPREDWKTIHSTISEKKMNLEGLPLQELLEIFGYIGWLLAGR
ncbi:hypothetical protein LR013_01605 [candidate division NPL-UPA2 bacterium]|nr:hypothetical protein [candidate division NPL-UPA2 bacterium]